MDPDSEYFGSPDPDRKYLGSRAETQLKYADKRIQILIVWKKTPPL